VPDLYRRAWDLRIGPIRIHGEGAGDGPATDSLDIAFDIEKDASREPNSAQIRIWNLSPETRGRITESSPLTVVLAAGYDWTGPHTVESGRIATLFSGDVRVASSAAAPARRPAGRKRRNSLSVQRDLVDVITTIEAEDAGTAYRTATVSLSCGAGGSVLAAIRHCLSAMAVGEGNLMELGSLGLGGEILTFAAGTTLYGQAHRELDRLIRSCGLTWSIQDGALQLRQAGRALAATAIRLTPTTGLIGSPEPDAQDGTVAATALLIPGLYPGRPVVLEARDLSGSYQVRRVRYVGDTAGAEWYAQLVLEAR
jgi:hypothetical protein